MYYPYRRDTSGAGASIALDYLGGLLGGGKNANQQHRDQTQAAATEGFSEAATGQSEGGAKRGNVIDPYQGNDAAKGAAASALGGILGGLVSW